MVKSVVETVVRASEGATVLVSNFGVVSVSEVAIPDVVAAAFCVVDCENLFRISPGTELVVPVPCSQLMSAVGA